MTRSSDAKLSLQFGMIIVASFTSYKKINFKQTAEIIFR